MLSTRRVAWLPALLLTLALLACNLITPASTPRPPAATGVTEVGPTRDFIATAVSPIMLTVTALAADVATGQAAATAAATDLQPATETRPPTIAPSEIATRAATSPVALKLADQGPWLIFSAEDGLWAANPDGSGLTQVLPARPYLRLGPAAPHGGRAVVLTASDAEGLHNLTLWLLTLPGGDLKQIAALTNLTTEPSPTVEPGVGGVFDVLYPLGQAAWSPDGANLAFVGAQAGPSADLFTYNLASGQVTRLTDGPSEAYGPSWSPDGRYVVQMGAKTFGSGAGYTMDGVWAAAADNSGVKLLYKPDSGGEDLLGWPGPETFAVTSFYARCAEGQVRAFNIQTGKVQPIFNPFYAQLAADPATGAALVAVDQFVAECDNGSQQGLFLARPGAAPKLLDANSGNATHLGWSAEAGLFYAWTDAGWLGFTPDGQPARLPDHLTGEPVVAPGGKNWAWLDQSSGLLEVNANGGSSQVVFDGDALHPTWSPDGQTLLFFANDKLYADAGDFTQPQPAPKQVKFADTDTVRWAIK